MDGVYQFTKEFPETYYIVYQTDPQKLTGVGNDQWVVDNYLRLAKDEVVKQNVLLWNKLEDLTQIKLKMEPTERLAEDQLEVRILSADGRSLLATGALTGVATYESPFFKRFSEPVFKVTAMAPYGKSLVILQLKNKSDKEILIGYSTKLSPYAQAGRQSRNEGLFYQDKELSGELALTTEYLVKKPLLYKKYSEDAYIMTE